MRDTLDMLATLFANTALASAAGLCRAMVSQASLRLTAAARLLPLLLLPCVLLQFVHVLFCLQVYLLSPFVRRYVRSASLAAHILLTAGMVAGALLLLVPLSGILSMLYVFVILGVSFVCPYWLVHIQKFKAKINGPWDEAVPRIPTSIHGKG